ncbi:hypothetical protein GCM10011490_28270 [Pseudoclavibacter endophyticus]|nr:hypothetical protein GCM10011490_28270 [Pseudoclavibacter endophyticus]
MLAVSAIALALGGCARGAEPAPTVPELTYAGAPEDDPEASGAGVTPTTSGATTAPAETNDAGDPDAVPSASPAVNAALQYAAIGGSEITGTWSGGCSVQPPVGVSAMEWRGSDLAVADGSTLTEITVVMSIASKAADGTPNVSHFRVHGAFGDGRTFDSNWAPYYQWGEVWASSAEGVYTFHYDSPDIIGTFELRVYCDDRIA